MAVRVDFILHLGMQTANSIIIPALVSAAAGLASGSIGWVVTAFLGRPILRFFDLKREAKQLSLLLWRAPQHGRCTPLEWRNLMKPLKAPRDRFANVGAEIFAFSQSHRCAARIIRVLGTDPAEAGRAIATIVLELGTDVEDRDKNYKKLDKALKFRIGTKGYFYDPYKPD